MEDILSAVWRGVQDEWRRDPNSHTYVDHLKSAGKRSRRIEQRLLKSARRRLVNGWGHRMGFELRYRRGAIWIHTARRCEVCDKMFSKPNLRERYCCDEHRDSARRAGRRAGRSPSRHRLNPRPPGTEKENIIRRWRAGRFFSHRDSVATLGLREDELVDVVLAGYKLPEPTAERAPAEVTQELTAEF
jgi:hypothetical protein